VVQLATIPASMSQHGMEVCNGKIYCAGGASGKKMYEYNPSVDQWRVLTDLPYAQAFRQSAIMRAVGSKLYYIGGYNQNVPAYYGNVYEYDPSADTWTEKTACPVGLEDMGSAVIGTKIYVFGGLSGSNVPRTQMYVYDTSNDTWDSTKAALPVAKALGDFGAACNGYIYAIGATNDMTDYPTSLHPVTTVYKYDPAGDSWSTVAALPAGTCYKEVEVIGNKLYVIGGADATFAGTTAIYVYDTLTDSWTTHAVSLPYASLQTGACAIGSYVYIAGGLNNATTAYRLAL